MFFCLFISGKQYQLEEYLNLLVRVLPQQAAIGGKSFVLEHDEAEFTSFFICC